MHFKIVLRSLFSRRKLYLPMIIAVSITLCLIGAAVIVDTSFREIMDQEMARYGANVILTPEPGQEITEGVPVGLQEAEVQNHPIQLAFSHVQDLLDMNPAWLVQGDGNLLVGQQVAEQLSLQRGDHITVNGIAGSVAILKSGTEFDQYVFADGNVGQPTQVLIRSDNPENYRGENATILTEMVRSRYIVLESISRLMLIIAIISSVASIATVTNLARVDAGRRQKEFGIFKSLGAFNSKIASMISTEYAILSMVSIITGIIGSMALSWGVLYFVSDALPRWNILSVIEIGVVTVIAFGLAGLTYLLESRRHRVAEELRGV